MTSKSDLSTHSQLLLIDQISSLLTQLKLDLPSRISQLFIDFLIAQMDRDTILSLSSLRVLVTISQFDNNSVIKVTKKIFDKIYQFSNIQKHYYFNILLGLLEDGYRVAALREFTQQIAETLNEDDKILVSKSIRIVLKVCSDSEKPKFIQKAFKYIHLIPENEQFELIDLCLSLVVSNA